MKRNLFVFVFSLLTIYSFVLIKPSSVFASNCSGYTTGSCFIGPGAGVGIDGKVCDDNHFTTCKNGTGCTVPLNQTSRVGSCSPNGTYGGGYVVSTPGPGATAVPVPPSCPAECRKGPSCDVGYNPASGCGTCPIGAGGVPQVCCKGKDMTYCSSTVTPPTKSPSTPLNITGVCNLANKTVTLSWSPSTDATSYLLRINNQTNDGVSASCPNGWYCSDPPDKYIDNYVGTSYVMPIVLNQQYNWWVHGNNSSGYGTAATGSFICMSNPTTPTNLKAQCSIDGKSVTLSWSPSANASNYLLRINNQSNDSPSCQGGWNCSDPPDKYIDNYVGTSYTFNVVPNQNYNWWVHGNNSSGYSSPVTSTFMCPLSTSTPTPLPVSAQCVSTKIYSPNWTEISTTTFSSLLPNSQVYFCVAGSSTAGAFDMARFTINNVVRPLTALQRPGSSDFCDLYTIPSNTYTFGVQGEVHHNTLGWL